MSATVCNSLTVVAIVPTFLKFLSRSLALLSHIVCQDACVAED